MIWLKLQLILKLRELNPLCFYVFSEMQVIAHGEQVFPRVKEKCSSKHWFASEDINSLEELIGRLRRLKENVGFLANRVTAIQAGLDSWQSEQINRKLYYLSFLSIIFLPLSTITGGNNILILVSSVLPYELELDFSIDLRLPSLNYLPFVLNISVFGMNVGGVPWTVQKDPALKDGFRNVMVLCLAMLILVLLCFIFPALYSRLSAWRQRRSLLRNWSYNRRSFLRRSVGIQESGSGGYLKI